MGRPSRKRSRQISRDDERVYESPKVFQKLRFDAFSLQSLVKQTCPPNITGAENLHGTIVQHVWAPLSDTDITSLPGLSLENIEVDCFGLGWLLRSEVCDDMTTLAVEQDSSVTCPQGTTQTAHHDAQMFSLGRCTLQAELQQLKAKFEDITPTVFKRSRSACNPAEALGCGAFMNRSAMKLANIDAICSLSHGTVASNRPLLFADLCGGPGGFSEYLLRRRQHLGLSAQGWGISIREKDEPSPSLDCSKNHTARCDLDAQDGGGDRSRETESKDAQNDSNQHLVDGVESRGEDPCAWQLERLALWGDVEFSEKTQQHVQSEEASRQIQTAKYGEGEGTLGGVASMTNVDDSGRHDCLENITAKQTTIEAKLAEGTNGSRGHVHQSRSCCAAETPLSCTLSADTTLRMTIEYGPDGTGDLTDMGNLRGFVDKVLKSTGGNRLDLVVADGGFLAARDALEQEHVLAPLAHCEALAALLLLARGGSFVCKLFEVCSELTASLVYILHRKFERIAIFKPITSRPASGERYIVCKGLLSSDPMCELTAQLSRQTHALVASGVPGAGPSDASVETARDIGSDAIRRMRSPPETPDLVYKMNRDRVFMSYLRLVNDHLVSLQVESCARIVHVASSASGRAWAFRDSRSNVDGRVTREVAEEDDIAALGAFRDAWDLRGRMCF